MKTGRIELSSLGMIQDSAGATGASGQVFTKQSNGTQLWTTPSASSSPIFVETFPIGACSSVISTGSASNAWGFFGTQWVPSTTITITTSSTMAAYYSVVTTGNYMFAIYRVLGSAGTHTRVASTSYLSNPSTGYTAAAALTTIDVATLTAGVSYILGMWTGIGVTSIAVPPPSTNLKTYIGLSLTNQGTIAAGPAPATITDSSTSPAAQPYLKLTV